MSQHHQHIDASLDTQHSAMDDSPTIGRTTPLYSAPPPSPLSEPASRRSQRKAAPSPLQTSTIAASSFASRATPTQTLSSKGFVDSEYPPSRYSPPRSELPKSPKERLDDLLASERSFYNPEEKPPGSLNTGIDLRVESLPSPPNGSLRSVSDPISTTKPGVGSSMDTRTPMAATAPPHRVEMARCLPRTSSIDSAISSISTSHSHKSSQDTHTGGSTSPDIGNLIQAAGSAEAVIHYLLKEKHSQAAQNTQLWRLVDKQRAMILGLNKDLERSLKDKDRYRKKLKESLGQIPDASNQSAPPAPSAASPSDTASQQSGSEGTPKAAHVESLVSAGIRNLQVAPDSPIDVALAPYPVTPPADLPVSKAVPVQFNNVSAEHKMPAPSEHAFQQYDSDAPAPGIVSEEQQKKGSDMSSSLPYNAAVPPSRSLPAEQSARIASMATLSAMKTPTVNIVEASPNVDQGQPKFPPPPRKPPPAPLNLGKKITSTSSHLLQVDSADDADSDYDDVLEVEEIPTRPERGRRKTREEDDREREIAAAKDAELRSLSKKSTKSSKSRPTTPKEKVPEVANDLFPPNPRQAIGISPPDAQLRHMSPPDSLAGSLAGMMSISGGSDIKSQHIISLPPMSPGLPISPRPMDRGFSTPLPRNPREATNPSLQSPPMSARGMGAFPSPMPLSPRAPRAPIPLPPNTPMSLASPGLQRNPIDLVSPKPLQIAKKIGAVATDSSKETTPVDPRAVFQGFVTEEYPGLLLPPNALPSIDVRVASSRLKPSRASLMFPNKLDEDPVFTLAVFARSDGKELWRVEKDSASLAALDQVLKRSPDFTTKVLERSLFSGHAPAKIDARRVALDNYFDEVLNNQMDMSSAVEICRYLSTNTMEPSADDSPASATEESPTKTGPGGRPLKNGYLTKRGKNFGGWKARFFVLDGPVFKYYEAPGGAHLGAIKLQSAQIGKQQQQTENGSPSRGDPNDVENQYRHAFLILEPKRKDSSSLVRHVLCAENDKERDQWVEALLQYVDYRDSEDEDDKLPHMRNGSGGSSQTGSNTKKKLHGQGRPLNVPEADDSLRSMPYEATTQGEIPHGVKQRSRNNGSPSPPTNGHERDQKLLAQIQHQPPKSISAPKNAQVIHDSGAWGSKQSNLAPFEDKTRVKKRSFFGFGSKPRGSADLVEPTNDSSTNLSQLSYEQHGPIRPVFGSPLAEAVRFNHPVDVSVDLPAVVYRCIEYLDAKNAAAEEGIFRLSGSNVVIKQLRERFNVEGDVNLITDDQYYDIHAVASLLKLYLRELPTTILTRELHLDFLAVTELHDIQEKIVALNGLVHKLPRANNTLLRYLAGFLINIINHADINKMTVRNVGIVFSPTLNIPAPVFALFLQQYDGIFGSEPDQHSPPVELTVSAPSLSPNDIRSPRRQHFQELPTPSYEQQSFSRQPQLQFPATPGSFPQVSQQNRAIYDTGFSPMQPSYEVHSAIAGPEYGQRAPTVGGPAYDQYSGGNAAYRQYNNEQLNSKAKKRESSMFGMGTSLGPRKSSNGHLKNDSRLVDEESFFD